MEPSMCGIAVAWFRENSTKEDHYKVSELFYSTLDRGNDDFGLMVVSGNESLDAGASYWIPNPTTRDIDDIISNITINNDKNIFLIGLSRATPEYELINATLQSQPLTKDNIVLVHNGSISTKTCIEQNVDIDNELDSMAIINSYIDSGRSIKGLSKLEGGIASVLLDIEKNKLILYTNHQPLFVGAFENKLFLCASFDEPIKKTLSKYTNKEVKRMNYNLWENFYYHEMKQNSVWEIDIITGDINEQFIAPTYSHPTWIPGPLKIPDSPTVLVSSSGGLDSGATLVTLEMAGYKPIAVFFKYDSRNNEAEYKKIFALCDSRNIELKVINITDIMKVYDQSSMLMDPKFKITTGSYKERKTTNAWTVFRNGLFLSNIAALAESRILNNIDELIYYAGGFSNLSESGVYPDNTERFVRTFDAFKNAASITGIRIRPMQVMSNILKSESLALLSALGVYDEVVPHFISCDRPIINKNGEIFECSTSGSIPACGSGLMFRLAAERFNLPVHKKYLAISDHDYQSAYRPVSYSNKKEITTELINNIIRRLNIHDDKRDILRSKLILK